MRAPAPVPDRPTALRQVWHPIDYLLSRDDGPAAFAIDFLRVGEMPSHSHFDDYSTPPGGARAGDTLPPTQKLLVTVPPGAAGLRPMLVQTPLGPLVQVTVPPGLRPGDQFEITLANEPQGRLATHGASAGHAAPPHAAPPHAAPPHAAPPYAAPPAPPRPLLHGYLRKKPMSSAFGRTHDRYIVLLPNRLRWHADHTDPTPNGELLLTPDSAVRARASACSMDVFVVASLPA